MNDGVKDNLIVNITKGMDGWIAYGENVSIHLGELVYPENEKEKELYPEYWEKQIHLSQQFIWAAIDLIGKEKVQEIIKDYTEDYE